MNLGPYKKYLLGLLMVILAFNFVDRLAMGLVLQSIKVDLSLSDTQLGLLTGIAFAAFYAVMGIPIARVADRGNRVTIISVTTMLWSIAVVSCGLAMNFVQLLLIRVAAGVGEAGCVPPAHSLIADYFSRAERARAFAFYALGTPLSVLLGYFLAGWLNQLYGWRTTFIILGSPGLLVATLAWLTVKEPRVQKPSKRAASSIAKNAAVTLENEARGLTQPTIAEVFIALWGNHTFRHVLVSVSVLYFFNYGILQWQPAFFIRSYGLATGSLGTWFAIIYGLGGILGTCLGGELAARYADHDERLQFKAMALAYCGFGMISVLVYLTTNHYLAFALMGLGAIVGATTSGPLFAAIQTLVPRRMRAVSIATVYLFANLIGMGLGPLAAGVLSDALRPIAAEESLRYALLILCPGYFWAAWHLWRGSRTVMGDLETTQNGAESSSDAKDNASNDRSIEPLSPIIP